MRAVVRSCVSPTAALIPDHHAPTPSVHDITSLYEVIPVQQRLLTDLRSVGLSNVLDVIAGHRLEHRLGKIIATLGQSHNFES